MPKKLSYIRSKEEVNELKKAMRSTDAKVARRATILYALHLGDKPYQVADRFDISVASVYSLRDRFDKRGVAALANRPKSGRPRGLSEEECHQIATVVEQDPRDFGYAFSIWTVKRLRSYAIEYLNVTVSEGTIRNALKRMGYVFRRPKFAPAHLQNPEQVEQFKDLLSELKKEPTLVISGYSLWTKRPSS